jgi:hypothetical protein
LSRIFLLILILYASLYVIYYILLHYHFTFAFIPLHSGQSLNRLHYHTLLHNYSPLFFYIPFPLLPSPHQFCLRSILSRSVSNHGVLCCFMLLQLLHVAAIASITWCCLLSCGVVQLTQPFGGGVWMAACLGLRWGHWHLIGASGVTDWGLRCCAHRR